MQQRTSALPGFEKPGLSFGDLRLEADGTLLRGETQIHLPPKELAALRLLLANAGRIVTPLQLRQALWGDVHVTADSVPKCVSSLRARLEPEECIQTIYKRGYRLTAEVRVHGAGPGGSLPRLAVFPFAGGYGVPEYLGPAAAEEAMARLSGAQPAAVSVLARDSVFTLARRGLTAVETGKALGADLVLAGVLRALPMHYRLRAEMIRVEDGTQLWVEDLLVERGRIAGLETELADRLASRLNSGLPMQTGGHPEAIPASLSRDRSPSAPLQGSGLSISAVTEGGPVGGPERREAYLIFQRAHHEWQTLERHRMQDALQHLLRAAELDPSLIGARVDLVNLCVAQSLYGYMSPAAAADIVRRIAGSTPDLTDRDEGILPAQGWFQFYVDRDLPAALQSLSLSAHLPHDTNTTRVRTMIALSRRRFDEALDLLRAAIQLDPFSPALQARLAWALHLAGDGNASVDQIRKCLRLFPEHEAAGYYAGMILAFNGEAAQATEVSLELTRRLPFLDSAMAEHAYALACAGRGDEARTVLERLQWLGRERFLLKAFTPAVYVALGEPDAALEELRASNEMRCPWFFQMLADPRLKPLESKPEFKRMCAILDEMEAETTPCFSAEE